MNNEQRLTYNFPALAVRRPLSFAIAAMSILIILVALVYRLIGGHILIGALDNLDAFTPVMLSILMLRGLWSMRKDTDLQAVSVALIVALSFIFIYEAIYKISLYMPPWTITPTDLREFLIQCGIALTVVAGFAFGKLHFSKWSLAFAVAFVLLYSFWMLAGFPQVNTNADAHWMILPMHWTWDRIYIVNRGTKVLMFFTYLFFYSNGKSTAEANVEKIPAGS